MAKKKREFTKEEIERTKHYLKMREFLMYAKKTYPNYKDEIETTIILACEPLFYLKRRAGCKTLDELRNYIDYLEIKQQDKR